MRCAVGNFHFIGLKMIIYRNRLQNSVNLPSWKLCSGNFLFIVISCNSIHCAAPSGVPTLATGRQYNIVRSCRHKLIIVLLLWRYNATSVVKMLSLEDKEYTPPSVAILSVFMCFFWRFEDQPEHTNESPRPRNSFSAVPEHTGVLLCTEEPLTGFPSVVTHQQ